MKFAVLYGLCSARIVVRFCERISLAGSLPLPDRKAPPKGFYPFHRFDLFWTPTPPKGFYAKKRTRKTDRFSGCAAFVHDSGVQPLI